MKKCAFLTLQDPTGYCMYDHLLFEPLSAKGWIVEEIPWNIPNIDWKGFDAVVIRSTWDYQYSPELFLSILEEIASVTCLYNPVEICRWNLNKQYLRELSNKNLPIVPTHWLEGLKKSSINSVFKTSKSDRLVAKPPVGAGASDTLVIKMDDLSTWEAAIQIFHNREVMLQPFVESIQTEGEYSLFYFGNNFSHAISKRPADGDFRVQEEHGGQIQCIIPDDDLIELGNQSLKVIGRELLYSRVDIVRLEAESPALIELELIEPSLYFEQCPEAVNNFVNEFERIVSSR